MMIPDRIKKFTVWDSINPGYLGLYRKVAGMAGVLIYIFVKWQQNIPDYFTKEKSEWVKLSDVKMYREGFGMDPKTKNKALRKLDKEGFIQVEYDPGKAPLVRLL
jgi:hypothetical protein